MAKGTKHTDNYKVGLCVSAITALRLSGEPEVNLTALCYYTNLKREQRPKANPHEPLVNTPTYIDSGFFAVISPLGS